MPSLQCSGALHSASRSHWCPKLGLAWDFCVFGLTLGTSLSSPIPSLLSTLGCALALGQTILGEPFTISA